jgi:hypothetical protein
MSISLLGKINIFPKKENSAISLDFVAVVREKVKGELTGSLWG